MDTRNLLSVRPQQNWIRSIFWANLDNDLEIHAAARFGFFACLFVSSLALVSGLIGGTPLAALVDILFFFMAGLGVRQFSRLATVAALAMFTVERIVQLAAGQVRFFNIVGIVVGAILFNALRAAYAAYETKLTNSGDPAGSGSPNEIVRRIDDLPRTLWPKLQMAFQFYLVGLIALMFIGYVVDRIGLLQ